VSCESERDFGGSGVAQIVGKPGQRCAAGSKRRKGEGTLGGWQTRGGKKERRVKMGTRRDKGEAREGQKKEMLKSDA